MGYGKEGRTGGVAVRICATGDFGVAADYGGRSVMAVPLLFGNNRRNAREWGRVGLLPRCLPFLGPRARCPGLIGRARGNSCCAIGQTALLDMSLRVPE
jgi:hypothetical protein